MYHRHNCGGSGYYYSSDSKWDYCPFCGEELPKPTPQEMGSEMARKAIEEIVLERS